MKISQRKTMKWFPISIVLNFHEANKLLLNFNEISQCFFFHPYNNAWWLLAAVFAICITVRLLLKKMCCIHYERKAATKYRQMWVYTRNIRVYLTFSLHWEKAMREERRKESRVIPFEFNTAGRLIDHVLWFRCSGKSTMNHCDDEWANTWNTGLIVVKMTVITTNGPQWMLFLFLVKLRMDVCLNERCFH